MDTGTFIILEHFGRIQVLKSHVEDDAYFNHLPMHSFLFSFEGQSPKCKEGQNPLHEHKKTLK